MTLPPVPPPSLAPGLLVAAPRSGSGKTTVTLGVERALVRRGMRVRGVKSGPDYIDPAFHAAATGAPAVNLDSFAMGPALLDALAGAAAGAGAAEIVVAEGSMGLFDGAGPVEGRTGASAEIARRFGWPVVLVLDVSGQAQSAAATALGVTAYDPDLRLAGVVLNKVASPRHLRLAKAGMARAGVPVLGALDKAAGLQLPERHLGLVQAGETADLSARLDALADAVERSVDLDALVAAAAPTRIATAPGEAPPLPLPPPGQRIAIALDAAFSFVYPHVTDGWRQAGASLHPFSPLADEAPPEGCDALWLPGGYPELHAGRLAAAERFRAGVAAFAETRPVHGECGGYMVLGESLEDADGTVHPMLGLLPVATSYAKRRMHLGYRVATLAADGPLGPRGARLVGHEFHYASVVRADPDPAAAFAAVADADGAPVGDTGHRRGRVTGTFFHAIATASS